MAIIAATMAALITQSAHSGQLHPRHATTPINIEITATDPMDGTQHRLPLHWLQGRPTTHRAYLEAQRHANYSIQITNQTHHTIGLVIAVDGRNIISGAYSNLSPAERMYVINPGETQRYDGWRTSRDEVNSFYFTDAPDSYAAAFDDYTAMGTIAVAAYTESTPRPLGQRQPDRERQPAPSAKSQEGPGTGFGPPEYSPSTTVDFRPDPDTQTTYVIKYEWRKTLCRKGIIDCRKPQNRLWQEDGYAPYPPQKNR
jgi:hypothetical protein